MTIWRAFLAIVFPPLAVLDKGCGVTMIVFLLTVAGWIPGVIAALFINFLSPTPSTGQQRFVQVPTYTDEETAYEKPKRKGAYVRLADGEVAEVIEDDGSFPGLEKHKRDPL